MAGWTCRDKETIEWDGTIKAKAFDPAGGGGTGANDWASSATVIQPVVKTLTISGANLHATNIISGAFLQGDGGGITGIATTGGDTNLWTS